MPSEKSQKNIIYPKVKLGDISRAFWQGIRPYRWLMFFLIVSVVLVSIMTAITPIFYKKFFDIITAVTDKSQVAHKLLSIIIKIAILNGIIWLLYRSSTIIAVKFQVNVIAKLKQQAYDYLMEHSYGFFTNNFTGSLVQKVNRFGRAFEKLADRILWDLLSLVVRVVSIIIIVFFINKWVALILFAWTLVFLLFTLIFSRWKIKYDIKVAEIDSKTTAYLADTITNQNNVQLFNKQDFESGGFRKVTNEQAKITKFNWNLVAFIQAGQSFLGFLIEFFLFYFAIKYWQQGVITVGFFVLLQAYLIDLLMHLWNFTGIIRDIFQSYADSKEMVEIMLLPHEIKNAPMAKEISVKKGEIEFKDLTFSFNETREVLKNVNLKIKSGEKVAFVGPSGAGKTTFVRLLLRLYSPSSGKILIDGQDISDITQESLRENISMVPQDPVLFHRTLSENIGYGKTDVSEEKIKEVVKLSHCDEFVKNLPFGLQTYVGERGIKLSGGERQRVAIARAILKNAPILVLDEATSSLDSHSEMLIKDALNTLMANRTTIVIAHRLSTIQKMDRIIVIDEGKIVEQGSHSELLAKVDSLYRKLWILQAGGFLTDDEMAEEIKEEEEEDEDGEKELINKNSKTGNQIKLTNF